MSEPFRCGQTGGVTEVPSQVGCDGQPQGLGERVAVPHGHHNGVKRRDQLSKGKKNSFPYVLPLQNDPSSIASGCIRLLLLYPSLTNPDQR